MTRTLPESSAVRALIIGCAVLGLLVGSFLNVVIWRVPAGRVRRPARRRTARPATTPVRPRDNVPVAQLAAAQGPLPGLRRADQRALPARRARHRRAVFAVLAWRLGLDAGAARVPLPRGDRRRAGPDRPRRASGCRTSSCCRPTPVAARPAGAAAAGRRRRWDDLLRAGCWAWPRCSRFYFLLALIYPAGMGFGDVKLAGVLGLYLGWLGLGRGRQPAAFLGFLFGGVVGGALMVVRRAGRKSQIPFGPFMLAGALSRSLAAALWQTFTSTACSAEPIAQAGARTRPIPFLTRPDQGSPRGTSRQWEGKRRGRSIRHRSRHRDLGRARRRAVVRQGPGHPGEVRPGRPPRGRRPRRRGRRPRRRRRRDQAALGAHQVQQQEGRHRRRQPEGHRPPGRPALDAGRRAEEVAAPSRCRTSCRCRSSRRCWTSTRSRSWPATAATASCAACSSLPPATWSTPASTPCRRPDFPVMVDLTSFAVIRSLADADHLGMGAEVEALVDVGARVTNIVVHQGGVPRFVRILLMGGQDVTDAVAERMGVPQEQAEAMKQQLGLGRRPTGMDAQAAVARRRGRRRGLRRRGARIARLLPGLQRVDTDLASRPHRRRRPPRRPGPAAAGTHPRPGRGRHTDAAACRSVAPACRPSRSPSSSRWPPCRSAWPSESHHEHADRLPALATLPQVNLLPPEIEEAAPVPQRAGRPRRSVSSPPLGVVGPSSSPRTPRSATRRTSWTPPRRRTRSCRPQVDEYAEVPLVYGQVEAARGTARPGDGPGDPLVLLPQRPEPEDPAPVWLTDDDGHPDRGRGAPRPRRAGHGSFRRRASAPSVQGRRYSTTTSLPG